jgi:hypothetical protein
VKWFQDIDRLWWLGFEVPFEEPKANTIQQKIRNREAVLLDWFDLFAYVEVLGWSRTHAPKGGRPRTRAVPIGPDSTAVSGFFSKLREPHRRIFPMPTA